MDIECSTKSLAKHLYSPSTLKICPTVMAGLNWIIIHDPKISQQFTIATQNLNCASLLSLYDRTYFPQCSSPIFLYLSQFHLTFIHEETLQIPSNPSIETIINTY